MARLLYGLGGLALSPYRTFFKIAYNYARKKVLISGCNYYLYCASLILQRHIVCLFFLAAAVQVKSKRSFYWMTGFNIPASVISSEQGISKLFETFTV